MSDKTREDIDKWLVGEMLWHAGGESLGEDHSQDMAILQAIRKILTESDIAHWMDRCHELEEMLTEKPVAVSRDDIDKLLARIYGAAGEYRGNKIVEIWLTELDIEVGDNSEVSRRTSDKEGE